MLSHGSPSLKLWHFSGGEDRKSHCQNLFTFYECSEPTDTEAAIAKSQNKVIVTSNYALDLFKQKGCENFVFAPLGFDQDFHRTDRTYLKGVTHFGLMGKFEKRKNTGGIIKAWLEKYGNNNKYQLTCCITNPFFKPEQMTEIINSALGGKRYSNINFLPYLKTNQEVFLEVYQGSLVFLDDGGYCHAHTRTITVSLRNHALRVHRSRSLE